MTEVFVAIGIAIAMFILMWGLIIMCLVALRRKEKCMLKAHGLLEV